MTERFHVDVEVFVDGRLIESRSLNTRAHQESVLIADLQNGMTSEVDLTARSYDTENVQDRILMDLVVSARTDQGPRHVLSHPEVISAPGLSTQVIAGNLPSGQTLRLKVKAFRQSR